MGPSLPPRNTDAPIAAAAEWKAARARASATTGNCANPSCSHESPRPVRACFGPAPRSQSNPGPAKNSPIAVPTETAQTGGHAGGGIARKSGWQTRRGGNGTTHNIFRGKCSSVRKRNPVRPARATGAGDDWAKKKAAQTPLSGLHLTTLYTRTTGARNGGLPGSFNPIPLRVPRIHPAVTIAAETHFFSGKFLRKSGGRNESRAKNRLDALEKLPLRPQPDATRVTRGEPRCNCQRIGPTGDVQQPVQDDVFGRKRGVGNHGRSGGLPVNPESASASITARPGSGNGTPVKFV